MDAVVDWSTEEQQTYYTMGRCHVLASALSRATGLPLGVMWNPLEWHVPPDDEGIGGVFEVVHVYLDCLDGTIVDIVGRRSIEEMKRSMAPYEHEICPCEPLDDDGLQRLVHDSCNLVPFDEADLAEAMAVVGITPALREALEDLSAPAPSY